MPTSPGAVFSKLPCNICGAMVTINGLGQHNHRMKHIREGKIYPSMLEKAQLMREQEKQCK
jgi:hypothetical protein